MLRTALASARLPLRSNVPFRSTTLASLTGVLISPTWRAPNSLDTFTEEEQLLRESEVVGPKLMGIETSAEHGGAESSFTSAIIAIEELAKVDPSVSVMCDVHNTLVNTEKWLPQLSTSKKDGDNWIINGSKMWITNSYEAEVFLIFANADPSKGYKGITCFLATKDMGVQIAKKEQKLGIRASSTCSLNFDDLKVPAENMLGLAQGAFDKAVPSTYERKQFGQAVGTFQGMAFQIAQAAVELETARLLLYNATGERRKAQLRQRGGMAKYWTSVVAQRVSGQAIEWAGGLGFTRETGIEKFWRDSKIGAIYEGTSNIQLQTIAKIIQKEYS
ncbi:acyl-CoA dehydrogenase/oxidase C-terminal [Lactarius quietus]|nr:acyl-CoA dehydrogenase/oxidase C-terminal [Lactarius quietus]